MIGVTLRIRHTQSPARAAAAWFIPGASPQRWLEELFQWRVPLQSLTLYIVPQSAADLRPRGVLVIAPAGGPAGASGRCQAYARCGQRLYVPIEARLEPELSDGELQALLPAGGEVFVFHPAAGLVGFEHGDARAVHDLLQLPPQQTAEWDRAQPGTAFRRRLTSIEPEATPTVEDVLAAGQDGIGSQAADMEREMDKLPPSPEEPSRSASSQLARGVAGAAARAVRRFLGSGPSRGGNAAGSRGRTPGRLARWAQQQLSRLDEQLNKLRHRSLLRLMQLLEHDPDKGLQYAISFGDCGHRGLAPPSTDLPRHPVDFNLGLLKRGGPADRWDVSADIYRRLRELYFQLANRELRLGRHRRAAYIYGMLLGMFDQAAAALTAGRHWREAAVLYRTRLNRPDEAARCLEQGGLWSEAIALYEELGEFEKAGDLLAGLDQPDQAARCYRQAALRHQTAGDLLSAARVLETKLAAPDEALQCLEGGWPNSAQAAKCLEESFRLLARLGRHERVLERIGQLRQSPTSAGESVILAETFAKLATDYPSHAVRPVAADAVRTIAARWLRSATIGMQERLLSAIRRLAPEDRLLARDCLRYLRPGQFGVLIGAAGPRRRHYGPMLVQEFKLCSDVEVQWRCAASVGNRFFAAGYRPQGGKAMVLAAECLWQGDHRWLVRPEAWWVPDAERPILLAPEPQGSGDVLLKITGRLLRCLDVPAAPPFACPARIGTPAWLPHFAVALATAPGGYVWTLTAHRDGSVLDAFSPAGEVLSSRLIEYPIDPAAELSEVLCVHRELAFVGFGRRLVVVRRGNESTAIATDDDILALAVSQPLLGRRVVAALQRGLAVCWDVGDESCTHFAEELEAPIVGFTLSGWLVAADAAQCQVWRLHDSAVSLTASFPCTGQKPVAVLRTTHLHEFALLWEDGAVRRYRVMP